MEIKLVCVQCNSTHGCQKFLRWGRNPHFCELCPERPTCHLLTRDTGVEEDRTFRCIKCINSKKAEDECSLAWRQIAERAMKELPDKNPYMPA